MAWTPKDKKRVAGIIRQIGTEHGTLKNVADKMGLPDRAVLTNWIKRGQVPLEHIEALLKLAPPHVAATPKDLHRQGHLITLGGKA